MSKKRIEDVMPELEDILIELDIKLTGEQKKIALIYDQITRLDALTSGKYTEAEELTAYYARFGEIKSGTDGSDPRKRMQLYDTLMNCSSRHAKRKEDMIKLEELAYRVRNMGICDF